MLSLKASRLPGSTRLQRVEREPNPEIYPLGLRASKGRSSTAICARSCQRLPHEFAPTLNPSPKHPSDKVEVNNSYIPKQSVWIGAASRRFWADR